jgi:hypothetical protein
MNMKEYTIIGYYEDTGQVWAQHVQYLQDEQAAIEEAVRGAESPESLIVVAVLDGAVPIRTPDEDGGKGVYAIDLQKEET